MEISDLPDIYRTTPFTHDFSTFHFRECVCAIGSLFTCFSDRIISFWQKCMEIHPGRSSEYGCSDSCGIDRRIRFLTKRLDIAEIVDPLRQGNNDQVFFGARVTIADIDGLENTYTIVGVDEADVSQGRISWISPLARALLKAREGDLVRFQSPVGMREIDILEVRYEEVA